MLHFWGHILKIILHTTSITSRVNVFFLSAKQIFLNDIAFLQPNVFKDYTSIFSSAFLIFQISICNKKHNNAHKNNFHCEFDM